MAKQFLVKVCGMRDADNIRQLLSCNINYIGFIFFKESKRYVGSGFNINNITVVPSEIKKVGVFVNEPFDSVCEITERNSLNYIQLHGDESPQDCRRYYERGIKIIKAFGIHKAFDFGACDSYEQYCDFFLFDTQSSGYGGTGEKFDWKILEKYKSKKPFFLSGGISLHDALMLREREDLNIHAIDINSRFEISSGMKDINLIKVFLKRIKH